MNLATRIRNDFKRLLRGKGSNNADVTVVWNAANFAAADKNIESTYPAALMQSGTWPAMVHYVQPATTMLRQFAEVQAGDVIVDFLGDGLSQSGMLLPTKPAGARFTIEGDDRRFVQKQVGGALADAWDVVIGGQHALRTFLLTQEGA